MSRLHVIRFVLALLLAAPAAQGTDVDSQSEREAVENAAWNAFCDRLKETGREIMREDLPATELDRAEGQRYLLQRQSASIDEVLDYVDHSSSLNGFQAVKSSDGRYRLVVALEDPGVPNWLDPAGHSEGVIIYRYQKAPAENPIPVARVVARSKLREVLPADTAQGSAEARKAEIRMRQQHAARRWAP